PYAVEGIEPGLIAFYIACSPEKTKDALLTMIQEINRITTEPTPQLELRRAKQYLAGRHEIYLQRSAAQAASVTFDELYGLGYEEMLRYPEEIMKVTSEDILKTSQKYFSLKHSIIATVGPYRFPQGLLDPFL
ncbi:MAG TPA: insulinase family protein, partial [Bdellovibrionota bacterium]|nr:insulinase family protein [Bdellovibrionota bacterium]